MIETEFVKRAKEQTSELVDYLNKTGANIKVEDVECCGVYWKPGAVAWKIAWYLVYEDSTKKKLRDIHVLVEEVNKKHSDFIIRKGCFC